MSLTTGAMGDEIHGSPEPYEGMTRDPVPPGGYPPLKRRHNPDSIFKESEWPASKIPSIKTIRKTRAQRLYKLTNADMCDLFYRVSFGPPTGGKPMLVPYKNYFQVQCERRAWEIHGGPSGLAAAQRQRNTPYPAPLTSTKPQIPPGALRDDSIGSQSSSQQIQHLERSADGDSDTGPIVPSTPQRVRKIIRVHAPSVMAQAHNHANLSTPTKNQSDADGTPPFQLPTPSSTRRTGTSAFIRENPMDTRATDDVFVSPTSSATSISRASQRDARLVTSRSPRTPRRYVAQIDNGGPSSLPTPRSSQKGKDSMSSIPRFEREDLGTLELDSDSGDEVRTTWTPSKSAGKRVDRRSGENGSAERKMSVDVDGVEILSDSD